MMDHTTARTQSHHRERKLGLLIGAVLLLSLLAAPVAAAKLATPTLISPANNQHFLTTDTLVALYWKPVPGPSNFYTVEIERKIKSGGVWEPYTSYDTPVGFLLNNWDPLYIYRWRVIAKDWAGPMTPSSPSQWRSFDVTREKLQLATPVQIAPPMAANLYNTDYRLVLSWTAVPGADDYLVEVEVYDPSTKTWNSAFYTGTGSGSITSFNDIFPGSFQGRWRITALNSGYWRNSKPSGWRTFTYKV